MKKITIIAAGLMATAIHGSLWAVEVPVTKEGDAKTETMTAAAGAAPFALPDAGAVVRAYGQYVADRAGIDAAQKQSVAKRVAAAETDASKRDGVITDSLSGMYPDFAKAMDLLANEKDDQAAAMLAKLMTSDDAYLAANAKFFAARLMVNEEKYEQAMPLLESLVGEAKDKTQYAGQAMFLRGVCQAGLLQRKEAMESLRQFIKADENAPERLIVGALHRLDELQQMKDGTLGDVEERMDYSRRKLSLEDSGDPTQDQQKKAVVILDELIKKAEEKEKGGGGGGGGGGAGGGQGGAGGAAGGGAGGAKESTAPVGEAQIGALHRTARGEEGEQWGEARQRQRDEVLNAIKAKYPERYRELVEQYYRALQEDGNK